MAPGIEIAGLWQGYQRKNKRGYRTKEVAWALRDVTLDARGGEILGLVGGNGSGKTTLLQSMAGVLEPMRGSVLPRGRVGSLIDPSSGFHRDLTGRENLSINLVMEGVGRDASGTLTEEIVAFAGLDPGAIDAPVFTYSAGMVLRLGFSILIHTRPETLVLDEVLAVGDAAFSGLCLEALAEARERGQAVMIASHDLDMVRSQCDRVAVLDHGQLIAIGPPDEALGIYLDEVGHDVSPQPPPVARIWKRTAEARRRRA